MDTNKISLLKNGMTHLMNDMRHFVDKKYPKAGLPKCPNEFIIGQELLEKGEFNLAVCGKVKNGKSSLINAMIGRDILPECEDVATSRVFKISNAPEDSFFVIYSNGDKEPITLEQLKSYGSQAEIDQSGELQANKTIAYIQVNTKINFLPDGVSLLDTPGIGSMYPQHTAITKRSIKMADAAIFVLNPTPMEASEIEFLKEIASVTPGIIFVTTKTDLSNPQSVEDAIQRNKEQIENAVGEKLCFGIQMLQMSSYTLKAASIPDDSDFNYSMSKCGQVKDAINRLVYLTLGVYRTAQAYNASVAYYQVVLNALQNRKNIASKASANYIELVRKYDEANKNFSSAMGENSKRDAMSKIDTIIRTMESDFNDIFSSKGKIYSELSAQINALTEADITTYSEKLGSDIVTKAQDSWDKLTELIQSKCSEVLIAFNEDCKMSVPQDITISVDSTSVTDPAISNADMRDKVGKMRTEMFMGTAVTTGLSTLVGGAYYFFPAVVAPALPVVAPVLVVLGVGAVLWGAIVGNKKAKQEKLQRNKTQLLKYLQDTLSSCKSQLTETSLANNKYQSLYQGFIIAVRDQAKASIDAIYNKYKAELDAMKATVIAAKQDPELIVALEALIKEWSSYKEKLGQLHTDLKSLDEIL